MTEAAAPYTTKPAHEHVPPSADSARAFGQILRLNRAVKAAMEHVGGLNNIIEKMVASCGLLQRDEPYCDVFDQALVVIEDELREIGEVRARAARRLELVNEGCPSRVPVDNPRHNGVAS